MAGRVDCDKDFLMKRRLELNMSQLEVAEKLGCSRQTVHNIENRDNIEYRILKAIGLKIVRAEDYPEMVTLGEFTTDDLIHEILMRTLYRR